MRFLPMAALPLALAASGCATTLSTLQPAEPMKPGHVQANAAMNVNVPASRIVDAVDVAEDLASRYARDPGYVPTTEEQRRALAAGVGLGLSSPGPNQDFMLRVGLFRNFDAGLRWSGLAAHVDGKYRFMGGDPPPKDGEARSFTDELGPEKDGGLQGSISIGLSKTLYSGFVFDALDYLQIGDYSRYNLEVPVIFGTALKDYGHVWFGPKYVLSRYSVDASLRNVGVVPETSGTIHHLGAFGGVAVGYKVVFFVAELTVMKMFAEPTVFGQPTDLGGIVVVPAGGLMLRL